MQDYRKLSVWQKSHELTLEVYKVSADFPKGELYGLTSQIRRAAYSVPSNIAEGCGRGSEKDFLRFLLIAYGSISELSYFLILSEDLGYMSKEAGEELTANLVQVRRMLWSFIEKVKSRVE